MGSATASGKTRAQEAIMKALDSPLLNDNKITGAKNVLLLIVSGSQEITIDEIGEINDHIQNEAGHGANIIMGVGEDESLQESISVTIIATGFNIDQQHEISNTEVKKVVHALEDDGNEDFKTKDKEPAIITPDIILEKKVDEKPEVVKHTLELDEIEEDTHSNLIATTEFIININVVYDEVLDYQTLEEEDFIITPVKEVKDEELEVNEIEEEEQITLTFDLPLSDLKKEDNKENKLLFELEDEVKDYNVKDYIEVIPVTEANETGETHYALDDFMSFESSMNKTKAKEPEVEEEIVFEKKVVEAKVKEPIANEDNDPTNSPISELLKERADERRRKMKDFNYKFNTSKIDEIEREPAYKRQGINLEETHHSSETTASRMSIGTDDNDDIKLRNNNSFLHDNVD